MTLPHLDRRYLPANPPNYCTWDGMHGSAQALAIALLAERSDSPLCVVARDPQQAAMLEQEISFYLDGAGPDSNIAVLPFPDRETLPYDSFSPHQDIVSARMRCLARLPTLKRGILIAPVSTMMARLPPMQYVSGRSLLLQSGQSIDLEKMRDMLVHSGYRAVGTVYEHGEFAVRGALLDVFPMGADQPYRIDLFDDEVDTLRCFDPETQRTTDTIDSIDLLPAREIPLDDDAISHFRASFRDRFEVDVRTVQVYQDVSDGLASPGIEYYLPLFFQSTSSLFDYLPAGSAVIAPDDLSEHAERFQAEVAERYAQYGADLQRPLLKPCELFLSPDELFSGMRQRPRVRVGTVDREQAEGFSHALPALGIEHKAEQPLHRLQEFLAAYSGRVLFSAESAGRREALVELLGRIGVQPADYPDWSAFVAADQGYGIAVAATDRGMLLAHPQLALISEQQLFAQLVMQRRRRQRAQPSAEFQIRSLAELRKGAPVVHIDHGVGRYIGLQTLDTDGQRAEFLCLEYADESKLYVPVSDLHLISRYSGTDEDSAPLHRLGSEQWSKARRKAAEKVRDTAAELLDLYARRQAREGESLPVSPADYERFAADFPFEETPDQQMAIEAIVADLEAERPMDRLVCGDVGFGKTEVAMRAAFVAVSNNRQVAVLVPTTLLAQQHFESFRDRFADLGVTIEALSRFRSSKEQEQILERAAQGQLDILIGTHKLIQGGLKFRRLGLLIIDEEHRFGVRQKEAIKALRAEVDLLTLTATPIPRTLNMAMAGMRDLSVIATPPARRLSIKTFVRQSSKALLREAILREVLRGGQVYFLHNDVSSIDRAAREIAELVSEAKVAVAHGQMRERELEQVMSDFYHKRFNVLVCSTIIETGIDVPNANTIIIERADKFGLAQLHQLRGRVGRSHHQAYAYLLTPHPKSLTRDAVQRLEAITAAEELGAGFTLASQDLEIRGAGELLGDEQSGHIQAVGISMFMDMLDRAVSALKDGRTPDLEKPLATLAQINLHVPALLPDDYIPDVATRLALYKRVATAADGHELGELRSEMIDRFGTLPEAGVNLYRIAQLRRQADRIGIARIEASEECGLIEFSGDTRVEPIRLVELVQSQPQIFQLRGGNQLQFRAPMEKPALRFEAVSGLLEQLLPESQNNASAA